MSDLSLGLLLVTLLLLLLLLIDLALHPQRHGPPAGHGFLHLVLVALQRLHLRAKAYEFGVSLREVFTSRAPSS